MIDARALAAIVAEAVEMATAPLLERIRALEARPALKYAGPYRHGESYAVGCFVSKGGSLWLCERSTSGIPGSADSGWRLVVKEGRAQ